MTGSRIFVSYRRKDSPGFAGRIADHLERKFGCEAVFRDVVAIECGADFAEVIDAEVMTCACLVVVMGPAWLSLADEDGVRRLDKPDDFVRLEVARALSRGIRVVPVLIEDACMPEAGQLPEDLRPLVRRQAIRVNDDRFADDMARLIRTLESPRTMPRLLGGVPRRALFTKHRLLLVLAPLALALASWSQSRSSNPLPVSVSRIETPASSPVVASTVKAAETEEADDGPPPSTTTKPSVRRSPGPLKSSAAPVAMAPAAFGSAQSPERTLTPQLSAAPPPASSVASPRATPPPAELHAPTPTIPTVMKPSAETFSGVWDGGWSDPQNRQSGKLHLEVSNSGSVAGWMSNDSAGQNFRMAGRAQDGALELRCQCPAQFRFDARGRVDQSGTNQVAGRLVLSTGSTAFGHARLTLTRTSVAPRIR